MAPTSISTSSSTAASSSSSSSSSTNKSFWPRELIFSTSPHPSQLPGGRQTEAAPMCPCSACWEYGSHTLAPPRPAKAPKAPKTSKVHTPKEKKSPLHFLKRGNASKESVASDMRPLRQSITLASANNSVYDAQY